MDVRGQTAEIVARVQQVSHNLFRTTQCITGAACPAELFALEDVSRDALERAATATPPIPIRIVGMVSSTLGPSGIFQMRVMSATIEERPMMMAVPGPVMMAAEMPPENPRPGTFRPGERIRLRGGFDPMTRRFRLTDGRQFLLTTTCDSVRGSLDMLAPAFEVGPFIMGRELIVQGVARSDSSMCVDRVIRIDRMRGREMQRVVDECVPPCPTSPTGAQLMEEMMRELMPAARGLMGMQRRRPLTGPGRMRRWDDEPRSTMDGLVLPAPAELAGMGVAWLLMSAMGAIPMRPINALAAQTLARFAGAGVPVRVTGTAQDGILLVDFVWPPGA